ncbi:out at first protein-like [Mercenaria mercenaria]|uniref:out at first protein-like n=1 Tax=Mercenaria mercenaria TaxID=6596 RepID=UPI00234FA657|nr:out at first protein-like [Mercenaria mercenaria]
MAEQLPIFVILSVIILSIFGVTFSQLVVNVRNKGGDVEREKIESNTTADTVKLEYLSKDGTLVTYFTDFKAHIQIFRVIVPWEEERGIVQSTPQVLCFITRFGKNEFISSDAMSKLRQKNPTAVRTPEEDKGLEKHTLNLVVNIDQSAILSQHLYNICHDARDSMYIEDTDVKLLSQVLNHDVDKVMSAMKSPELEKQSRCKDTSDIKKPCFCQYHLCVGWYPCGLKYCRGKDSAGKVVNYRCGIKTCRRCLLFEHFARQKMYCLWDDL